MFSVVKSGPKIWATPVIKKTAHRKQSPNIYIGEHSPNLVILDKTQYLSFHSNHIRTGSGIFYSIFYI
jgi:hypothetical protein